MIFILIFNIVFIGLLISTASNNLFKKIIGLAIFQSGVLIFYIAIGYVYNSKAPIIKETAQGYTESRLKEDADSKEEQQSNLKGEHIYTDYSSKSGRSEERSVHQTHMSNEQRANFELDSVYSNPLPQVLMLTAIVVGIATLAVAIALILRIQKQYKTIDNNEILEAYDDL
jgi:multicomponent Na+:H+ antiporter subunit C